MTAGLIVQSVVGFAFLVVIYMFKCQDQNIREIRRYVKCINETLTNDIKHLTENTAKDMKQLTEDVAEIKGYIKGKNQKEK